MFVLLASVCCHGGVNAVTPECALEGSHRWWVRAVLSPDGWVAWVVGRVVVGWVEGWVALSEDVLELVLVKL